MRDGSCLSFGLKRGFAGILTSCAHKFFNKSVPNSYIPHLKILKSDIIENSRIELRGIVLPAPSNQIKVTFIIILPFNLVHDVFLFHIEIEGKGGWIIGGGGQRACCPPPPPPLKLLGGLSPPPFSYAYEHHRLTTTTPSPIRKISFLMTLFILLSCTHPRSLFEYLINQLWYDSYMLLRQKLSIIN